MFLIPLFLLIIVAIVFIVKSKGELLFIALAVVTGSGGVMGIIYYTDISIQTADTEVWSGVVEDWSHKEEWDEWVPPQTTCTSDAKGNQSCTTTPGYWVHHDAENHIKTTDNGWISVTKSPDGRKFDDSWPNDVGPLKEFWKKGSPTASTHSYRNNVQASYSIFKNENINLEDFKDLPEYPDKVKNYVDVDRIIGSVPNKKEATQLLAEMNSHMNKMVKGEDGKKRSWKQVNVIFVNVGADKPQEYGLALQDKWENGNKNDFIVSFSMNKDGKLNWVYPFTWSEVERLKIDVRELMMQTETISDFKPIVKEVSNLVIEKYERKEFADFDYLSVDLSTISHVLIWISNIIAAIILMYFYSESRYYR